MATTSAEAVPRRTPHRAHDLRPSRAVRRTRWYHQRGAWCHCTLRTGESHATPGPRDEDTHARRLQISNDLCRWRRLAGSDPALLSSTIRYMPSLRSNLPRMVRPSSKPRLPSTCALAAPMAPTSLRLAMTRRGRQCSRPRAHTTSIRFPAPQERRPSRPISKAFSPPGKPWTTPSVAHADPLSRSTRPTELCSQRQRPR